MARPIKNGLDYFPLDVTLDTKFELLEAEFGLTGFAVVIKLFQEIYKNGYYCEWNSEVALLFARKNGLGGNVVSEIVKCALKRGIFNIEKFKRYGILTSAGIQKRYIDAIKRRKNFEKKSEYLLVQLGSFSENINNNEVNVDINSKNAYSNTQSKVKESKGKKSKVVVSIPKLNGGSYEITEEQLRQLKKEYPELNVENSLNKLSYYIENNPNKRMDNYKSYINMWLNRDVKNLNNNKSESDTGINGTPSYDLSDYENNSMFD